MSKFSNAKLRTKVAAGIATAVIAGGGVAAYAAFNWTTSGTGSGGASAYSNVTSTVTAASGSTDLYPGGTGNVNFTVNNPNPYNVTFTGYTISSLAKTGGGACSVSDSDTTANVYITSASGAMSLEVDHGATAKAGSLSGVLTMNANAPATCEGATFSVTVSLSGAQSA